MVYELNKNYVSNNSTNTRIFIINRYTPPTSIYRYTKDLLSVFGKRATLVNLNFYPRKIQFNDSGVNFSGRFARFFTLNHFLRGTAFANFRRYIEDETQGETKVILHYTNQFSGTFRIPKVTEILSVHDSPFYTANSSIFNKIYMRSLYNTLKEQPYVVTNTEHLKGELMSFGFTGEITTIYLPYSPIFRKLSVSKEEIRVKLGLPLDKKLILSVSSDSPRKNLRMVKEVSEHLGSDFRLIRVGAPLGNSITFGGIDDVALNELYNACDILLFPSLYEGFGLPIVEAFASGLPVVTSDIPTIREVAGDAAILCNPHDAEDLKAGVIRALSSADDLTRKGIERSMKFTFDHFEEEVLSVYDGIVRSEGF